MADNDRNFEEKRNFIRMTMNASAVLTIDDDKKVVVTCIDLSALGMAIETAEAVSEGSNVHIDIESQNKLFNSMSAACTVVRCHEVDPTKYELGLAINKID